MIEETMEGLRHRKLSPDSWRVNNLRPLNAGITSFITQMIPPTIAYLCQF